MRAAVLALSLMAGAAAADVRGTPDCAQAWEAVAKTTFIGALAGDASAMATGGCIVRDVRLNLPGGGKLSAQSLRLPGDLAAAMDGAALPAEISFEIEGLGLEPATGNTLRDRRISQRIEAAGLDAAFLLTRDTGNGEIRTVRLMITASDASRLDLAATTRGGPVLADLRLEQLDLVLASNRLLADHLLPVLTLFEGGDAKRAGAAWDKAMADAATVLDALPAAVLAGEGRAALGAFFGALPQARGRLDLSITSAGGLGPAQAAGLALADWSRGPDGIASLLSGLAVRAEWRPGVVE